MVGLMRRPLLLAALLLSCAVPCAHADEPVLGSMRLPLTAADLASALGIHRVDPATLPVDIVRLAFASPGNPNAVETAARRKLTEALARRGSGDLVPLPLSPRLWREQILFVRVADEDLAAAIFSRRNTALLYHGLLAVDPETLAWLERNPAVVRSLAEQPGAVAAFAGSIRIRGGAIETPGDEARAIWTALVGADPDQPAAFVHRLLSIDAGSVAAFYHTIDRLDAAHQAFAIGRRGDPRRLERARELLAVSRLPAAAWNAERPFLRPDIDLLLLLRTIAVDERGALRPPATRALWAKAFGEGSGGSAEIDAAWLARQVFADAAGTGRRRLDTFRFAQRALGDTSPDDADLALVLREHPRLPLLMSVIETFGERRAAAYAAATSAANAVEGDDLATMLFQSALAAIDRAHRSRTLDDDAARALSGSLAQAAVQRQSSRAIASWIAETLIPSFRRSIVPDDGDGVRDADRVVLEAFAGRPASPPIRVTWEGAEYIADVAASELRRLMRARRQQREPPLDAALAQAAAGSVQPLVHSLAALVYATALGPADGAPQNAGDVWRRHRLREQVAGQGGPPRPWRIATEVFGPSGWHLSGSLLRLDLALAPLALRRLDTTEMPDASQLSTSNRRALATTIALIDPQGLTDADRDGIAAALERGRTRIARLADAPDTLDRVAADAGLSGWRRNSVAWLLVNDRSRVPESFTLLEQFRLGGGAAVDAWGASTFSIDACVCVRQPATTAWEDYTGRASSGQLAAQLPDVMLRTADVLAKHRLPALLARDVAAYAMQDAIDRGRTAYFDDWLPIALAVRELPEDRFVDYVAALTVAGPLNPVRGAR
jgi:hypothetical protein